MILITSTGKFILYFVVIFFLVSFHYKKKYFVARLFLCCVVLPYFYCRLHVSVGLNCDQMEPQHEEQYSQERNLSSNMSMRDYRHIP